MQLAQGAKAALTDLPHIQNLSQLMMHLASSISEGTAIFVADPILTIGCEYCWNLNWDVKSLRWTADAVIASLDNVIVAISNYKMAH
jgi:hypothetical protein